MARRWLAQGPRQGGGRLLRGFLLGGFVRDHLSPGGGDLPLALALGLDGSGG
ncbi:hypothetical protein ABZ912_44020 [Nonomuraea angiospora]|uniref:hypothetical protein n=1 Tax=Nonomuraea angiospora TaxID=46172 RepID=UPI00340432EF